MLNTLIELSHNDNHKSDIATDKLFQAKTSLLVKPNNNIELLNNLIAMNLINAVLKRKEFKSKEKEALIHYGLLKPRVSRLFDI